MQFILPDNSSLPTEILDNPKLLPRTAEGAPSITNIQHAALAEGVARGKSLLVVGPTSTGKTLVGIWGLVSWLQVNAQRTAVYLVTHRALARQKFEELTTLLRDTCFDGDGSCIVLSNGDTVVDANGNLPGRPLEAPVLVATYEKYLAMISGAGMREDMTSCAVICDEIQILGDEHRGRNVEILLTLLRCARWGQVIGLSAVLEMHDAAALAEWLNVQLIHHPQREKHLRYECRTPNQVLQCETNRGEIASRARLASEAYDPADLVEELVQDAANLPLVVFAMTKEKVYEGARAFARNRGLIVHDGQPLLPGLAEATAAAHELSCYAPIGLSFHTADLLEEERLFVEGQICSGAGRVVFATTTLAAGVNFPFRTAVFDSWKRWDTRTRVSRPIPSSEFHNMAGRVGRMGFDHEYGRVLFCCDGGYADRAVCTSYLSPDRVSPLTTQLVPRGFAQVALQLIASGICSTEEALVALLLQTFSAQREQERNRAGLNHWRDHIREAIGSLRGWGYVL